jgi:4-hydroxybenzoate polyprenyltransferase
VTIAEGRPPSRGLRAWIELSRPFTLLPPFLGMLSGACSALGAGRAVVDGARAAMFVVLGAVMAALLNAASNALNQIYDLDLDRVNKPLRPLVTGAISIRAAKVATASLYAASILLAFAIAPAGRHEIGWIVVATTLLTWAYSAPPIRARNSWWLGPLVIAAPRGLLLKVAGWGTLAPVFSDREPWVLGGVFFAYVLGAAPTKDFSDVEGDRAGGASSLPIRFGAAKAASIVAAFLPLPGVLFATLPWVVVGGRPLLAIPPVFATILGLLAAAHGAFVGLSLRSGMRDFGRPGDHRVWRQMYLLMMELQIAAGALYFVPR